jgi:hypothetical protein
MEALILLTVCLFYLKSFEPAALCNAIEVIYSSSAILLIPFAAAHFFIES